MKLEDQVVSLELSQKLSELGVKAISYWSLIQNVDGGFFVDEAWKWPAVLRFPAYTVAELGSMLPDYTCLSRKNEEGSGWWCEFEYVDQNREYRTKHTWGDTMAEPPTLMLIWLIENGHLSVEEVNCGQES